jgi:very-short-patch-repair endonuclease
VDEAEIARLPRGDAGVAEIGRWQNRVASRAQLRAVGLSDRQIDDRRTRGLLHLLYRAVFHLGPPPVSLLSLATAAVLAVPNAVLSHFTAGWLHGFWREPLVIDVIAGRRRDRPGLRAHLGKLRDADITRVHGLPVTSAARTVVDIASQVELDRIGDLVDAALMSGAATRDEILRAARRRTRGVAEIRKALHVPEDVEAARSRAERKLMRAIREAGLPVPESNHPVAGYQFDLVWPEWRLIVEYDSWLYHHAPGRFARDRERSNAAQQAGFAVLRYTEHDEPGAVVSAVRSWCPPRSGSAACESSGPGLAPTGSSGTARTPR